MYIRTDDDNNIIELIIVGVMPEKNGYEIDMIDEDIIRDILNYKYIDGNFIKSETNIRDNYIDDIRSTKIDNMSQTCNLLIERGIDFGGSHYSLTTTDQINLMKLESIAKLSPDTTILYHADGEDCRVYSTEEIISIATLAMGWITYNTTYFNQLKAQINEMSSIDDIISINYGSTLDETHNEQFQTLTSGLIGLGLSISEITDNYDYELIIPKVSDDIVYDAMNPKETITTDTIVTEDTEIEEWKDNPEVYVPEEDTIEDVEEFPSLPDESSEETGADESVVENEPVEEIIEEDIIIDESSNVSDGKSVYTPAEDNGIPDTSIEVEWEEEVIDEEALTTDETNENNGGYQSEEITDGSDSMIEDETIIEESEEITDEETGTELHV